MTRVAGLLATGAARLGFGRASAWARGAAVSVDRSIPNAPGGASVNASATRTAPIVRELMDVLPESLAPRECTRVRPAAIELAAAQRSGCRNIGPWSTRKRSLPH